MLPSYLFFGKSPNPFNLAFSPLRLPPPSFLPSSRAVVCGQSPYEVKSFFGVFLSLVMPLRFLKRVQDWPIFMSFQ